jgi:hypothetical protein
MTIDERLDAVAHNLDVMTKIHLDNDREFRERMDQINEAREKDSREFREKLRRQDEAREKDSREFRERLDRLTSAQERNTRDIQSLTVLFQQEAESIRALARIAERHQERLDGLDPQ